MNDAVGRHHWRERAPLSALKRCLRSARFSDFAIMQLNEIRPPIGWPLTSVNEDTSVVPAARGKACGDPRLVSET